jgi:hypothetical protein
MKRRWSETLHAYYDSIQKITALNPLGNYPLNKNVCVSPFFIIGSGRSGNTLLRRIIAQAPGIHIPPETYVVPSLIKLFRQNNHLLWRQIVNLMLANIEYNSDFETFLLKNLRKLAAELYETAESDRSLAFIIDKFYRFHANEMGIKCERWGDKTPLNTIYLERIHSLFPDALYVNIIRNGYDVAYSYVSMGLYKDLEEAAERWKESIQKADKFIQKNQESVLTIHYEDLVSEPQNIVREVCIFLNIGYDDSMLSVDSEQPQKMGDVEMKDHHSNVKKPITTDSIGKGRRNLSASEKQKLSHIIGKELKKNGYEQF